MPNSANGKHRVNPLDFLLIVLIIAIISAAIVSVIRSNPNRISGGDATVTYTIVCNSVNAAVSENIVVSDLIYDNESNQLLGTVKSVQATPLNAKGNPAYIDRLTNPDGEFTTDMVTLTITVEAMAWKDGGLYSIDKYRIAAGQTVNFHSEHFSLSGICTYLKES